MTNGPKQQQDALRSLLISFHNKAKECSTDLQVYDIADKSAESLANLVNAQTTAALVAFHVGMKRDIFKVLDDVISRSGTSIIEEFKNKQTARSEHDRTTKQ